MTKTRIPRLGAALRAWNTTTFAATLARELECLERGMLPLDRCVSQGSAADDGHCTVMVLRAGDDARAVHARVGVFFTEVVGGCSCGDDPASIPAYCELRIRIDKTTAEADIGIVPD